MWSPKQSRIFDLLDDPGVRGLVIPGPTQSGKSFAAVHAFASKASESAGMDFGLGSHSQRQLQSAVIAHMESYAAATGSRWRKREEYYELDSACIEVENPAPNRFYTVLGSNAGSTNRAKSYSFKAFYADEATDWDPETLAQLIARCSQPDPFWMMVTNPAGPLHPIHVKYIVGAEGEAPPPNVVHLPFSLWDNPMMTQEYIDDISVGFTGAMKQRMVDGLWVAASGAIYPQFSEAVGTPPAEAPRYYTASADFGMSNATAAGLFGHYADGTMWLLREYYHDGRARGSKRVERQADEIRNRLIGDVRVRSFHVDQTATDLIVQLKREGLPATEADNAPGTLLPSIQLTNRRLEDNQLRIARHCTNTIRSMSNYVWDETSTVDKPVKQDDHAADMVRYAVWAEGDRSRRDRSPRERRIRRR